MIWVFVLLMIPIVVFIRNRMNFWRDRGIPTIGGSLKQMGKFLAQNTSVYETWLKLYKDCKSQGLKHAGSVFFLSPSYIPIDIEIVKDIMQTNFQHFVDRGVYYNEKGDPLSAHLFSLEGLKWKLLRNKLTPTFTSGKMKMMFDTLVNCTQGLYEVIDDMGGNALDIKDILARFTTDIIGNCAFGLECNSLKNDDSEFRRNGKDIFTSTFWRNLKNVFTVVAPKLSLFLNIRITPRKAHNFFMGIVRDTLEYREKNNIYRKDFMHLLIQLKNRGKLVDDEDLFGGKLTEEINEITFEEIAAQVFVFFLAGFETSSTTMTYCLYELARNGNVQEKLRAEIKEVLKKHDGKLTYDAVMEMKYLEQCIYESLRKYPPLTVLFRQCTKDYQVPGSDLVLEKGQKVLIPVIGIHMDPEYYPDPEAFDPDRFSEENKKTRPACSFLAFGEGPRICIGLRFGMMQTKVGLIAILVNYKVSVNEKTKQPLEFDPRSFVTSTKGKMWLDLTKISPETIDLRSRDQSASQT